MKRVLKSSLSLLLAITIIFSSAYVGLSEVEFDGLFAVKAHAASTNDLTFVLSSDGTYYSVSDCDASASGGLVIPDTYNGLPVTQIGYEAFYSCNSLTSITIPDSIRSIGWRNFVACGSLTSIDVDSENIYYTSVDGVLFSKDKTELIRYPADKTKTSYVIPDSVTSIASSAFESCIRLTSVTIPDSIETIGEWAFGDCKNLDAVHITDISSWCNIVFSGVTSNPLYYARNLYLNNELVTEIIIPESVKTINQYAFYNCVSLTSITIPDSVTSIGYSAFYYCTSLASATIGNGVTSINEYAFYCCTSLVSVTIGNAVTTIDSEAFRNCTSLKFLAISNSVTTIGEYAFTNCTSLELITIPDSVISIGAGAFANCTSLASAEIGNGVAKIRDYTFEDCTNLISVTIPDSVIRIDYRAFYNCTSLTSITIPDSVTSIGDGAFYDCTSLTSITIPASVTSIGSYAFEYCTSLTSITIPDSAISICDSAFYDTGYYNDESNWLDDVLYINKHFIEAKTTLSGKYKIKEGVKTIAGGAFSGCTNLTSVIISDGVKVIGNYAFSSCTNLTSIVVPNSVIDINGFAFKDCNKFSDIYYKGSEEEWNEIKIDYFSKLELGYVTIHYNSDKYSINHHVLAEGGTTFELYNKNALLEAEALNLDSLEYNHYINNATVEYNGTEQTLSSNSFWVSFSNLSCDIDITAPDFYKYIIPKRVADSFKVNSESMVSVYMTKVHKDGKPYISTVFGRTHDDECENVFKELQTNSLKILEDKTYDIIVTADLKGDTSATYYLSQDSEHRVSNSTGVFSKTNLYNVFEVNKPVYAYAVTSSGKVTEPVTISIEKIVCSGVLSKLLSSPTINLLGSDLSKFTISDSIPVIGGAELSMSFLELPIGVELDGERVRISIGRDFYKYSAENGKVKEDKWISFKEYCKEIDKEMKTGKSGADKYKDFEKAQKQRGFGSDNIKREPNSNLDFDASYLGYIEGYVVNGNVIFTEFCGTVAAEFIAKYTVNTAIGPVPAYFYIQGGANAALSLGLARTIPDENIPIEFDVTVSLTPELKVGGGVGTKGVASAGIYGSASLPTAYEFIDKHLTMALTGTIGVEGEFLIFAGNVDLLSGTVNVIDKYFGVSKASLGSFSQEVYSQTASVMYSGNFAGSKVKYTLASRDYAESTSDWLAVGTNGTGSIGEGFSQMQTPVYNSGGNSKVTVTELQTSVYKNSQTQLVQFGDKVMLAYVEDCAERDTYNRYRLMYTVYNPSTNTWTTPKAVCDSGKMDVSPSLASDGENVYIAWQTVNTKPTAATEEALYDAMNNMEIYSAKYDSASDSFVNVTQHTNNSTYDYSPYVSVENGSATVYWVNAESTNFAAGEMSIHSSIDSTDTLVYNDMNYIVSVKASGDEISYSMDVDGDIATVNDIKLFTDVSQVGEGIVENTSVITNFTYGEFNGEEKLFYSDGVTVYYVEEGSSTATFTAPKGVSDSLHITNLNGKPAVIYTQLTDKGSELCVSIFENNTWSESVYLTDIGCLLSNVDIVSVDGKVYAVFDRTQTTEVTDEEAGNTYLEHGQTDLCMLISEGYYDLEISNIGYNEGDISVGSSAPVIVVMENKGTEAINNVSFVISDSLGYSRTISKNVNLAPGAIESVELEYVAQEGYASCDLTVSATISDDLDVDVSNNTTSTQIGRTDISAGAVSVERIGDVFRITCDVSNDSLVDAENVNVKISCDAFEKDVAIDRLAAKSAHVVEMFIAKGALVFDENDVSTLTFSVSTDSEEIVLGNNENTVTVDESEKLAEHEHNYVDNVCDGCGLSLFTYDVSDDGATITGYNGTDTEVSIPESINGINVIAIGDLTFAGNEAITSIVIPDNVSNISEGAFANCENLTTITVGESNSKYTSVDGVLFNKDLTELIQYPTGKADDGYIVPDSVTGIKAYAFSGCDVLKYIFYSGSESEWADIAIGDNNESLINAVVHYNSTGHSYEYKIDNVPTCTLEGSKHQECTVCGHCLTSEVISSTGHSYSNEWTIDVEPTCSVSGSKSHHCTVCGTKTDVTVVSAIGHIYVNGFCSICGLSDVESAHPYENNIDKSWTINREGAYSISITFSNDTETEDECDYIYIYDGNNNQIGEYTGKSLAGQTITIYSDTVIIRLTSDDSVQCYGFAITDISVSYHGACSHENTRWVIAEESTCTTSGSKHRECTDCGEVLETSEIIAQHTFSEWTIDVEPTCAEEGIKSHHCTVCGEKTDITAISAIGHIFGDLLIEEPTCEDMGMKYYECSLCGYIDVVEYLSVSEDHSFGDLLTEEPTCEDMGMKYYECSLCGYVDVVEYLPVLEDHISSDWIIDIEPTCTNGSRHKECIVCGEVLETSQIISEQGHFCETDVCSFCGLGIESEHPYENDIIQTWTIFRENAKRIAITFSDDTETETDFDYIYIYNAEGDLVGEYSGTELAGERIPVIGDEVIIVLKTDSSENYYGFKVTQIEPFYEDCSHPGTELRNESSANCTCEGYTGDTCCVECGIILSEGDVIPVDSDAHDMYEDTYEANCVDGGYILHYCCLCYYSYMTDETEPTGIHNYENGLCSFCGHEDPDGSVPMFNVGETKTATISDSGERFYFTFVPKSNGVYSFASQSEIDTYASIYDSSFNQLDYDDDAGYGFNFKLSYYLEAGEKYIIECLCYDDYTGSFDVCCDYEFYTLEGTRISGGFMFIPEGKTSIDEFLDVSEKIETEYSSSNEFGNCFGTGAVFQYYDGFENDGYSYTIVVEGDTNGDSVCDALDAAQVALVSNGHKTFDGAYGLAADTNLDEIIDIDDYQAIVNKVVA